MNENEARQIVSEYHNAIVDLRPEKIVQPKEDLPYPSGWIKYAHYVMANFLVEGDAFNIDIATWLCESYGLVNILFTDDHEDINSGYANYVTNLKSGKITDFDIPNPFGGSDEWLEFKNFLGYKCYDLDIHNPFTSASDEDRLGPFVFEKYWRNAQKGNDLEQLKAMSNLGKTVNINIQNKSDFKFV